MIVVDPRYFCTKAGQPPDRESEEIFFEFHERAPEKGLLGRCFGLVLLGGAVRMGGCGESCSLSRLSKPMLRPVRGYVAVTVNAKIREHDIALRTSSGCSMEPELQCIPDFKVFDRLH